MEERTVHWGLTAQLLEHFGGTGQSVTGFADGDVEDEFLDAELAHGVCALVFAGVRLQFPSQPWISYPATLYPQVYHCYELWIMLGDLVVGKSLSSNVRPWEGLCGL